jgi:hypothetical protein
LGVIFGVILTNSTIWAFNSGVLNPKSYTISRRQITTSAEDSAVLLEIGMHKFAIRFLPQPALSKRGAIPRSHENLTVYLNELRVMVVRIMVSHRWLQPGLKLPDLDGNEKHLLLQAMILRLLEQEWINVASVVDVVLWVDFACINQDSGNPAAELNGRLVLPVSSLWCVCVRVCDCDNDILL